MRGLVLRHVRGLQSLFGSNGVSPWFVLMTESNLGLEAAHIANLFKQDPSVVSLRETGAEGRFGVLTTHQRKLEFVALLENLLLQDAVRIAERVTSDDAKARLDTLKKQLLQYRMVCSEAQATTVFNAARITYSGKVSENGKVTGALQDDLCIALQLAVFWSSYVLQRKCKFLDYDRFFS